MTQEKDRSGKSDSSRFLVAGAARSYWVRTAQGQLAKAIPAIRRRIDEAENAILESNSIVGFLKPDLYISVLDPATEDFKVSAREFLTQADAVMLHDRGKQEAHWQNVVLPMSTPAFAIHPPNYVNAEIIAFVESRLKSTVAALP